MTLQVEFKKGGYVYEYYFDVPETVYRELLVAESVGTFVNQNVRSNYRYTRV
jgi:KTSC domain